MADQVLSRNHDGVALITLNRPVGNALTSAMRQALIAALTGALGDPQVRAIVLNGAGPVFCSGMDLGEYDGPLQAPLPNDLCLRVEDAAKPVVCALHGMVSGAGMELALATHARIAQRETQFAMPDVRLGLVPVAGGTQRLPRLTGAGRALELLLSGQSVPADDPRLGKVVTRLTAGDPVSEAIACARELAARGAWPRTREERRGLADPAGYQRAVAAIRAQVTDEGSAEAAIIACVAAAQLLPFAQGLACEEVHFQDHVNAPCARGLRHALMAERRAALMAAACSPPPLREIVVLGADDLACEAAAICLGAAGAVTVIVAQPDVIKSATRAILQSLRAILPASDEAALRDRLERLQVIETGNRRVADVLARADLVLDSADRPLQGLPAISETAICAGLRHGLRDGSGVARQRPARFAHLNFHRPLTATMLVELSPNARTEPQAIASLTRFLTQTGCRVIRCPAPGGYLGNRMLAALQGAAIALVAHGASPYDVDAAARRQGFAAGPFQMMDRDGLRQSASRMIRHARTRGIADIDTGFLQVLADKGRHGRAAGRGIYTYGTDGPGSDRMVADLAAELAVDASVSGFDEARLGRALLAALANEGAVLLSEQAVQQASDLDLVALCLMGFARHKGGPLFQADLGGIFALLRQMKALGAVSPLWKPHPRIEAMVRNGQGFFGRSPG